MKTKKIDPFFKARFGIKTPIKYVHNVMIPKRLENRFKTAWKKIFSRRGSMVSPSRKKQFDKYLVRLEKERDDLAFCEKISIRYIRRNIGYGVFAKEDISPYAILIHYAGVLALDDKIKNENDSTFGFSHLKLFSIDAQKNGNWARFMNHAEDRDPTANVVAWEYYTKDRPHIIFTAGRKGIKKGEQLLYSYGDDYWEEDECLKIK